VDLAGETARAGCAKTSSADATSAVLTAKGLSPREMACRNQMILERDSDLLRGIVAGLTPGAVVDCHQLVRGR
jgi:hypothetical protein